jgi:hypothetical protein
MLVPATPAREAAQPFIADPSTAEPAPVQRRRVPMTSLRQPCFRRGALLVLAGLVIVQSGGAPALEGRGVERRMNMQFEVTATDAKSRTGVRGDKQAPTKPLPGPVEEMRQAILAAAHSGDIDDLVVPLDWNEMKPDLGKDAQDDPTAYWKKSTADEGREILAVLANILEMKPAELPLGKDLENNIIYVWPYLAEAKLDALTPAEQVDLLRLVPPEKAKEMRESKKWTWWRLSIGADGTWHSFKKPE